MKWYKDTALIILVTYIVMLIFTFGYAFNRVPDTYRCFGGHECQNGSFEKSFMAMVAGICWPFYWSVEVQK